MHECQQPLHPRAADGIRLFNQGRYFEAHEALEDAWNDEPGEVRDLYRGILQAAVVYLHLTRGNAQGARKVYARCTGWLSKWPAECRGVEIGRLRDDLRSIIEKSTPPEADAAGGVGRHLLKPIAWREPPVGRRVYLCDRCGSQMREAGCKIFCPNCGSRHDCSDLSVNLD